MSNCCSTSSKKYPCPHCEKPGNSVATNTILYHIKSAWQFNPSENGYYFCANPDCQTVYFNQDKHSLATHELRTTLGLKTKNDADLVCYCFGISNAQISPESKDFVVAQTKASACSCTTHNPSGRCCLKDFPKF